MADKRTGATGLRASTSAVLCLHELPTSGYRNFILADNLRDPGTKNIEQKVHSVLNEISEYYENINLKPNREKTEVSLFHLNKKSAKRKLKIVWEGMQLTHKPQPEYLEFVLDRTRSSKHCRNIRKSR